MMFTRPMVEGFLLGIVSITSVMIGIYFLRFWRQTRDVLFLAFASSFLIEGVHRGAVLFIPKPNEGALPLYMLRFLSGVLILAGILKKNSGQRDRS